MTRIRRGGYDPASRAVRLGLVVTVGVAAAARLWGLDFGLPHVLAHPDESRVARTAVGFLTGSLNPGFFNYPSLFMYAAGLLDAAYCAGRVAVGSYASITQCAASWPAAWEPFFITTRLLSAASGTATVAFVYLLGTRLFDRATGLAGAALLSVTFLHVRDSHFGVTDVAMTALAVAALVLLARAHDEPARVRFLAAGLVAGLAASTKYNAALLAAPLAVSAAGAWAGGDTLRFARVPIFGTAMAAGFLAGTPYAIVDFARFWTDAWSEAEHLMMGHGIHLDVGWRYHASVTLWHGVSWPILLAGVGGSLLMLVRRPLRGALLLAFPVVYYIVAGRGHTVFARYMVPVVPFLCLAAAYLVVQGAAVASRRWPFHVPPVAAIAVAVLALPTALTTWQLNRILARDDSRVLAAQWIRENVGAGESIYLTGSHYGRPDVHDRGRPPAFVVLTFDEQAGRFRASDGAVVESPDWLVVQESPLVIYSSVPEEIQRRLEAYELRQSYRAIDMNAWHVFDQQDALFVPLAGFKGVGRPGPNLSIYKRRR